MNLPELPNVIVLADGSLFPVAADGNWRPMGSPIDTRWLERVMPPGHHNFKWEKGRESSLGPQLVRLMRLRLLDRLRLSVHTASAELSDFNCFERFLYDRGTTPGGFGLSDVTEELFISLIGYLDQRYRALRNRIPTSIRGLCGWALEHHPEAAQIDPSVPDSLDGIPWEKYQGSDLPAIPSTIILKDHSRARLPETGCWRFGDVLVNTRLLDRIPTEAKFVAGDYRPTVFDPSFSHICRLWLAFRLTIRLPSTALANLSELITIERLIAATFPDLRSKRWFTALDITPATFEMGMASPDLKNRDRSLTALQELYAWGCSKDLPGFDRGVGEEIARLRAGPSEFAPYSVIGLPPLPVTVRLPGDDQIDAALPLSGIWKLKPGATINTQLLDYPKVEGNKMVTRLSVLDNAVSHSIRLFLADRLTRVAISTVFNDLNSGFIPFERWLAGGYRDSSNGKGSCANGPTATERYPACPPVSPESISAELLEGYRTWANQKGPQLGQGADRVVEWYARCAAEGYPGYLEEIVETLIRKSKHDGASVGYTIRERNPVEGAFSEEEYVQIVDALEVGLGGPRFARHRALVEVCLATLARGEAIRRLKRDDLWFDEDERGDLVYYLSMLRAKRRAGSAPQQVNYEIDKRVYELLESLYSPHDHDRSKPLIPMPREGELTTSLISQLMTDWSREVGLQTLRVPATAEEALANPGGPYLPSTLRLGTRRFRHTGATILAEQGFTAEEIADALDDDTLEMALIYTDNTSGIVVRLSGTIDKRPEFLRILRMFRGQIATKVDDDLPRIQGGIPWFRNYSRFANIGVIAGCDHPKPEECDRVIPVECYICKHCRAVEDERPHRRQLQQIQEEQAEGIGIESDRSRTVLFRVEGAIVQLLGYIRRESAETPAALRRRRVTDSVHLNRSNGTEE